MANLVGDLPQHVLVGRMEPMTSMIPEMAEALGVGIGAPADATLSPR